jgi:hypothetical protein
VSKFCKKGLQNIFQHFARNLHLDAVGEDYALENKLNEVQYIDLSEFKKMYSEKIRIERSPLEQKYFEHDSRPDITSERSRFFFQKWPPEILFQSN